MFKVKHIPRKAGVYQCTTPSGSYYIGRAADMKERVYQHHAYLKRGEHANQRLQRSYDKYGGRLKWSVLFVADTVQTAIQWEYDYLQMFWGDAKLMNMRTGDGFTAEENERNKRKPVFAMNRITGNYIRLNYVSEFGNMIKANRGKKITNTVYGYTLEECEKKRTEYSKKMLEKWLKHGSKKKKKSINGYHIRNIHTGYVGYAKDLCELKKIKAFPSLYSKSNSFVNGWQVRKIGSDWSWLVPIVATDAVYGLHVTGKVKQWKSKNACECDLGHGVGGVFIGKLRTYKGWSLRTDRGWPA